MAEQKPSAANVAPHDSIRNLREREKNQKQALKNPDDSKDSSSNPPSKYLKDGQQSNLDGQKKLVKNGQQDDPPSDTNRQEDLDKGSTQNPQSDTRRQEDLDKGSPQDPQSDTRRQEDLDKGSPQDPPSVTRRQKDLDKGSPQDPPSDTRRQEDLDKGSPQDPPSDTRRQEDLDKGSPQDPQRDKDNTQSGQSIPREPDDTPPQQNTFSTPGETKKGVCSCLLMSTFISSSILGGLLVIGFNLINPWSKPPDPVYNIVPSWGMCPNNPQPVPLQIDFNSSTESRIQEEIDRRETILKAELEAKLLKLMVDIKKDMNTSAEKAIENRILELNVSTENRIKDISETLSVHLNESTENRLQDVFQEQSKISDKMKTVEDGFQEHKQVNEDAVAAVKRQLNESLRNISNELNRTLDHFNNDTREKFLDAEKKRELVYLVMEHMNFMRADSWGMLVLLMGAMEVILYLYIFFYLNNRRPRSTDARASVPVAPPARVDSGDNNTACIVYFVERDLKQIMRWGNEVIEETHVAQRIRNMDYGIASRDDIQNIPTCRLALVFVNPDERQLILEDKFHMGSTRRDTVQALRDKGAEVILIVYGDPTSRIRVLQDELLFDPSLTQVTSHPVLRDLNSRRRILSVKESFSAYQKQHLVDTIDQIFA